MPPTRITDRLLLRPIRVEDRARYARWLADNRDHLAPWSPRTPPNLSADDLFLRSLRRHERGECARILAFSLDDLESDPGEASGGEIREDAPIVGMFNLNEIVRGPFQNAYAGWAVAAAAQGRGYATEGVRALLSLAFSEYGLQRVQANILPRNQRSLRVAERAGMRFEGLALRYLEIDGVREDHAMYARLAQEP